MSDTATSVAGYTAAEHLAASVDAEAREGVAVEQALELIAAGNYPQARVYLHRAEECRRSSRWHVDYWAEMAVDEPDDD